MRGDMSNSLMLVERRKGGQVAWDIRHGEHVQKKGSTDGFTDERGVLGAAEDVVV